jgi:hypothetical protein
LRLSIYTQGDTICYAEISGWWDLFNKNRAN